jgi:peptidoglycan hydrolase-like protein with peptidoglycan-binding domain
VPWGRYSPACRDVRGARVEPIRKGDRGPGVEDVQRRLLALGEDLGPTGVDGVFLGATYSAVRGFQQCNRLDEDGIVGPQTWSALVDAGFCLGDRLLYLRMPYFHGADVRELQGALNALGFSCGGPDGIFGHFTERAVREFQANTALLTDGIAGPDTFRAIVSLRHVWIDKSPDAPQALKAGAARSTDALAAVAVAVLFDDDAGRAVAERLANLGEASEPSVRIAAGSPAPPGGVTLEIRSGPPAEEPEPEPLKPLVVAAANEPVALRIAAALASGEGLPPRVVVLLDPAPSGEQDLQRLAVGILDGLCLGLAAAGSV